MDDLLQGYDAPTLRTLTAYRYLVAAMNALCAKRSHIRSFSVVVDRLGITVGPPAVLLLRPVPVLRGSIPAGEPFHQRRSEPPPARAIRIKLWIVDGYLDTNRSL